MKQSRKIIALMVAMVISLSLIPQAVPAMELIPTYTTEYEEYFTEWSRWDAVTPDKNLTFSCVTNEIAHSGKNSIVLRHADSSNKMKNICLAQSGLSLEAGNYTISFWAVGTRTDIDMQGVTLADPWRKYSMQNLRAVETDGIWSKYEIEVTMNGSETAMTFFADGDTNGWYIDDISLVKAGTSNNRIKNGGFEGEEAAVLTPTYTAVYEKYFAGWGQWYVGEKNESTYFTCVTNELAHGGSNSVVLRHTDRSVNDNLYVVQENLSLPTGTYTVSFWAAGTGTKQFVNLQGQEWLNRRLESCTAVETDGIWSKYEMDFTVPAGKTNNTIVFGAELGTEGWYIDDICLVKKGTNENLITNRSFEGGADEDEEVPSTPAYTTEYEEYLEGWVRDDAIGQNHSTVFSCVTNAIAHSGNNSVILRHTSSGGKISIVQRGLSLGAGTYKLSLWAACTEGDINYAQVRVNPGWIGTGLIGATVAQTDGIWSEYTMDLTIPQGGETATEIHIITDGQTDALYIDDISLAAQGTTSNLLTNGGFEEKADGEVPETPTYTTEHEDYFDGWSRWDATAPDGILRFSCVTNELAHSGSNSIVLRHADSSKNGQGIGLAYENIALTGVYTLTFWAVGARTDIDAQAVTLNGDAWVRYSMQGRQAVETDGSWSKYVMELTVPDGITDNAIAFFADGETTGWYIDDISLVKKGETENLIKNAGFEEKAEYDGDSYVPDGATYTSVYEEYFFGWSRWDAATPDQKLTFSCITNELAHSGSNSIVLRHTDNSQKMSNICLAQDGLRLDAGTYTLSFWAAGNRTDIDMQGITLADPWRKYSMQNLRAVETDGIWSKYEIEVTMEGSETAITFFADGDTNGWYIDDIRLVKSGEEENLIKNGGFEERDPSKPVGDVVKEVVLKKNGQRTDALMGAGDYSVTLVVDNTAIDTKLDVEQFVAIYDEDGVLYNNVHSTAASIEKATASGAFTKIETDFNLPEGSFKVEYFVFDGRDTLNIIGSPNPHRIFE